MIFLLWGKPATIIKPWLSNGAEALEASHPSPLSAHRGFLECGHFKKTNELLLKKERKEIDW